MRNDVLPSMTSKNSIRIADPLSFPEGDIFARNLPIGSFFYTSSWARVLIDSYHFKPHYFIKEDINGVIGMLPVMEVFNLLGKRKGVALPFTDFCGPLASSPEVGRELFLFAKDFGKEKGWGSLEIRDGGQGIFEPEIPIFSSCFSHELDIGRSEQDILRSMRDSTSRNIKKAVRENIQIAHESSRDSLEQFIHLNDLCRRDHGLPSQPKIFFSFFLKHVLEKGNCFITIARFDGRAIAANVFLVFGEKAIYKYGANDRKYGHLRASNLVMWEGIKKCRELGCKTLNFGRTEPHHSGLLQFKRGFGCIEKEVKYYKYNFAQNKFILANIKKSDSIRALIFSKLPIPILKIIGKFLYKYVG
jgi:hypothetical protein